MKHYLSLWLLLLLLIHLPGAAWATAGPPAAGRPLAEALNSDGTLKAGAAGSFDARAFRMRTAPDGRPVFSPAGTAGTGDERWADGFALPDGVDGEVHVVVQSGVDVYIGGNFEIAGGAVANNIAKWNGTTWSGLGTGVGVNSGVYPLAGVYALAVASSGEVYVGGTFTQAGGTVANHIAKWNGTTWSSLSTGSGNGVNDVVYALAVASSGEVYVGGTFTQAGGTVANHIAKWNGTTWSSLSTGSGNGVNDYVIALAVASSGEVYVGGIFTQAGGGTANYVAKWDGITWSSLGTGAGNGVNDVVYALAVTSGGEVYVGGILPRRAGPQPTTLLNGTGRCGAAWARAQTTA